MSFGGLGTPPYVDEVVFSGLGTPPYVDEDVFGGLGNRSTPKKL